MNLKQLCGKKVKIASTSNGLFSGIVTDYIFPEDNESEKESIIVTTEEKTLVEFEESDIKEITIIS